jgi:hypothetical protein
MIFNMKVANRESEGIGGVQEDPERLREPDDVVCRSPTRIVFPKFIFGLKHATELKAIHGAAVHRHSS